MIIQSIYFDTLGHSAAEINLKEGLPLRFCGVEYRVTSLSQIKNEMGWKAKILSLFAFPLFAQSKFDFGFNRLRSELAFSAMVLWYVSQLDKNGINIFHFRTQSICLLLHRFIGKHKVVITIDMTTQQLIQLRSYNKCFYLPITWLEKRIFNSGAMTVCYSNCTSRAVMDGYGVNHNFSLCIHPSVRSEFYTAKKNDMLKKPRILFVGNDFVRKGGDLLLKVFNEHFADKAELHLVSNDSRLDNLKVGEGVLLHKNIRPNTGELVSLFANSDIFVLPTREEAYGIVFSEAMAAGLPCIGTKTMAIPELIQDGKTGYLIEIDNVMELKEKLDLLLFDNMLRNELSLNAKKSALERFTLDLFLDHYYSVFKNGNLSLLN